MKKIQPHETLKKTAIIVLLASIIGLIDLFLRWKNRDLVREILVRDTISDWSPAESLLTIPNYTSVWLFALSLLLLLVISLGILLNKRVATTVGKIPKKIAWLLIIGSIVMIIVFLSISPKSEGWGYDRHSLLEIVNPKDYIANIDKFINRRGYEKIGMDTFTFRNTQTIWLRYREGQEKTYRYSYKYTENPHLLSSKTRTIHRSWRGKKEYRFRIAKEKRVRLFILPLSLLSLFALGILQNRHRLRKEELSKREEERRLAREIERKKEEQQRAKDLKKRERERKKEEAYILATYGKITKQIRVDDDYYGYLGVKWESWTEAYRRIIVFQESSTIFVEGNGFKFEDILAFEVYNNSQVVYSGTTSTTSGEGNFVAGHWSPRDSSFGGTYGRSASHSTTQTSGKTRKTINDYEVVLTINDLSNPTHKVEFGENQKGLQEFVAILTIILQQRKK